MIFCFSLETGTHYVALTGPKLKDPPASASLMLELKGYIPDHAQLLQDS